MKTLIMLLISVLLPVSYISAQNNKEAAAKANNGKDMMFINEAASGGLMEVELGKLAQQKATSQDVKDFGKLMERDHSDANKKLTAVTQKLGMTAPTAMMEKHRDKVDNLKNKDAADFDMEYIDLMVKDHKEDIDKFQKALDEAQNAELKQWISSTLPVLKQHLAKAESVQEKLKNR